MQRDIRQIWVDTSKTIWRDLLTGVTDKDAVSEGGKSAGGKCSPAYVSGNVSVARKNSLCRLTRALSSCARHHLDHLLARSLDPASARTSGRESPTSAQPSHNIDACGHAMPAEDMPRLVLSLRCRPMHMNIHTSR